MEASNCLVDRLSFLQRTFPSLASSDLESLAGLGFETRYEPEELLAHEGAYASGVHLVQGGILCTGRHSSEGTGRQCLRLLGKHRAFGMDTLFVDGMPVYSAFAKAIVPSDVIFFERADFLAFAKTHPPLFHDACRLMAPEIRWLEYKLARRGSEPVDRQLAGLFIGLAHLSSTPCDDGVLVDIAIPRQMMAELLGVSIAALLRHLKRFRERGLIQSSENGRFVLRDFDGLVECARMRPADMNLLGQCF